MRSAARRHADRGRDETGSTAASRKGRSAGAGAGATAHTPRTGGRNESPMELANFFPYRLAVLSEAVSHAIARVYAARFDLTRDEWRVLAALGEAGTMNTQAALLFTTLDKVQASRAVQRMERKALIEREKDATDRRNRILRLTPAGRALYRRIVPVVKAREAFLLEGLDAHERATLDRVIARLMDRARELETR